MESAFNFVNNLKFKERGTLLKGYPERKIPKLCECLPNWNRLYCCILCHHLLSAEWVFVLSSSFT